MRCLVIVLLASLSGVLLGIPPVRHQDAEFKNLVGAHLAGTWTMKEDVTAMLAGPGGGQLGVTMTFREDSSVTGKVTGEAAEFIKKQGVFMSGIMTKSDGDFPFVLTQVAGSPYVFWFRERKGNPMGDSESFFVSVAVGGSQDKDLLFIGGDFDNQAFSAYGRAKPK